MKKEHIKFIRKIGFILVLIIFAVIIYLLFPIMKGLATEEGRIIAKEKLSSFGIFGALIIIILEALKVFVVVLPGEPIELLAGMCFGPFLGVLVVYIGIIFSTFIISKLVKKFGISFVKEIVPKEKFDKVENIIYFIFFTCDTKRFFNLYWKFASNYNKEIFTYKYFCKISCSNVFNYSR